jgi:rare lipoprotein A
MKYSGLALILIALAGCSTSSPPIKNPDSRGKFKVGKPYKIDGEWYSPRVDWNYNETGIASWYGEPFHGKPTASGEIYDKHDMTAAHKTLPLPTIVRVTNLDNDSQIDVRINDRGPFVDGRIIDLSYAAAKELGVDRTGLARVRVQILAAESKQAMLDAGAKPEQLDASGAPKTALASRDAVVPAASAAPAMEINELPPETASAASAAAGAVFVQAGAFASQQNAASLASSLGDLGTAKITPVFVNGQQLYRVRLGPFEDPAAADELLNKVVAAGQAQAKIVLD